MDAQHLPLRATSHWRRHSSAAGSRWRVQGRAGELPRVRGRAAARNGRGRVAVSAAPKLPSPARMSQQKLESYLWGAAIILRGLVDAADYKQFVFPLVFFK